MIATQEEIHSNYIAKTIKETFGLKTFGLSCLPIDWVPRYLVLPIDKFDQWRQSGHRASGFLAKDEIQKIQDYHTNSPEVILRSSSTQEGLNLRGRYKSIVSDTSEVNLSNSIQELYQDFINQEASCTYSDENQLAIIIQAYLPAIKWGHASNERRVTPKKKRWVIETEGPRANHQLIKADQELPDKLVTRQILSPKDLQEQITNICSYLVDHYSNRQHIEWIVHDNNLHVVQLDFENPTRYGSIRLHSPYREEIESINDGIETSVIVPWRNANHPWYKIDCVRTFVECGLSAPDIFVLEDPQVLEDLRNGILSPELKSDIEQLLQSPIVIRTDVANDKGNFKLLLPRSGTIDNVEDTYEFLTTTSKELFAEFEGKTKFSFLIHHFVFAAKSAFAETTPSEESKVVVNSLFGVPDGLLYNDHDSFQIQSINKGQPKISKKIRYKPNYLQVAENGEWKKLQVPPPYDWKSSLSDEEATSVARMAKKIAKHVNKAVTCMFLVGTTRSDHPDSIMPMFFHIVNRSESSKSTDYEVSLKRELVPVTIKSESDISKLRKKLSNGDRNNSIVLNLEPNINLTRNRHAIAEIAELAVSLNASVHLKGSKLSHIYYILTAQGIPVRTYDDTLI